MIIKASQRSHARELARHLLNGHDNEFVEVHKISGFIGENVPEALAESELLAKGTRCAQHLFSVSFNPPKGEVATIDDFEDAIARLAQKTGLQDQPHVIVFHEKDGRRHAHCIWSRIDSETMTAVNMSHFKTKCAEVSKSLYLDHGWELPKGHIDKEMRNPLNFILEQWQHAKRLGDDPAQIKLTLQECWATSDDRKSLEHALEHHGFALARGDRRGFVAVDWRGEVYSLSRWSGHKSKELKERLGDPKELPSVDDIKANTDRVLQTKLEGFLEHTAKTYRSKAELVLEQKSRLVSRQDEERRTLEKQHSGRNAEEIRLRQSRFSRGFRGIWDRVTGKHSKIREDNEHNAYQAMLRDRAEKDALIEKHLKQRVFLQERIDVIKAQQRGEMEQVKQAVFSKLPDEKIKQLQKEVTQNIKRHDLTMTMNM